jgi:Putative peptidoglycan binding domain
MGGFAMRSHVQIAAVAACLLSPGLLSLPATAGTVCESGEAAKYLPPLPRGCQWRRIEASGELSFGIVRSAGTNARKSWERQVITFFGERYADWAMAACKKVFCVEASIAHSHRCTYSAYPCAVDADKAAIEALNTAQIPEPLQPQAGPRAAPRDRDLSEVEIRELQELLRRAGYRVGNDGMFGEQTQRALASWQRRNGLPDNANPNLTSLEDLRRLSVTSSRPRSRER